MVKIYEESQSSNNPLTPEDVVNTFMNAAARSDYHPGRGYGPPAVGRSSQKRNERDELKAALQEERNLLEQQGQQVNVDPCICYFIMYCELIQGSYPLGHLHLLKFAGCV